MVCLYKELQPGDGLKSRLHRGRYLWYAAVVLSQSFQRRGECVKSITWLHGKCPCIWTNAYMVIGVSCVPDVATHSDWFYACIVYRYVRCRSDYSIDVNYDRDHHSCALRNSHDRAIFVAAVNLYVKIKVWTWLIFRYCAYVKLPRNCCACMPTLRFTQAHGYTVHVAALFCRVWTFSLIDPNCTLTEIDAVYSIHRAYFSISGYDAQLVRKFKQHRICDGVGIP